MTELANIRSCLNQYLESDLAIESDLSAELVSAMRYAVLGGGKRLRGCLVCATSSSLSAPWEKACAPAAAVEYMHAYSLVHDDLPHMDDAELRRGQPSCHVAFGETVAILAGDALQALAFSAIADCEELTHEQRSISLSILAQSSGWMNMVGGQALDMKLEGQQVDDTSVLDALNGAKTGALFRACSEIGSVVAGYKPNSREFELMSRFAGAVGLAFQITDDVLDASQSEQELGKPTGADAQSGKCNYVTLLGLDVARDRSHELLGEALTILEELGLGRSVLAEIAGLCVNRST